MVVQLNNNAMYLEIISRFSDFTCILYVQGLCTIPDTLLKWLAEYTRHHPWRFVYVENIDVVWMYSENRDRCDFSLAPPIPAMLIHEVEDPGNTHIANLRPSHVAHYNPMPAVELRHQPQDGQLLAFLVRSYGKPLGDMMQDPLEGSRIQGQFRREMEEVLLGGTPSIVLLQSPPGAGKTYHMDTLQSCLKSAQNLEIVKFDGSSEVLVTHTLTELLQKATKSQGNRCVLILDEYHMLCDVQKDQLFD